MGFTGMQTPNRVKHFHIQCTGRHFFFDRATGSEILSLNESDGVLVTLLVQGQSHWF